MTPAEAIENAIRWAEGVPAGSEGWRANGLVLVREIERLRAVADKAAHALAHAQMWVDDDYTETEMIDAMRAVNAVLKGCLRGEGQ